MKTVAKRISSDLKLDETYIEKIIDRSQFYYRTYKIDKRNGDKRPISQPSAELKTLQYWVRKNILMLLPVSTAAFAYKKGDSVKKHAEYHREGHFLFHTDIQHFFPSIRSAQLKKILSQHKDLMIEKGVWTEDILDSVSKICFHYDSLTIGAVTSPIISNIIMYSFDETMLAYCVERGYKYSRYADDIYISSKNYIPLEVKAFVKTELNKLGFKINSSKTWFASKKGRRKITGIILTDEGKISVGINTRNHVKKLLYDRLVHGKGDPDVIIGYLSYIKDVEPATYNNLLIKYSTYCEGDVLLAIRSPKN